VAEENDRLLLRGVSRWASLRRQSDSVAVPTVRLGPDSGYYVMPTRQMAAPKVTAVRLGPAVGRRGRVHRIPDPEPRPLLPHATGQRQPADPARQHDEISDRHRLQREPHHVLVSPLSRSVTNHC